MPFFERAEEKRAECKPSNADEKYDNEGKTVTLIDCVLSALMNTLFRFHIHSAVSVDEFVVKAVFGLQ